MWNTYGVACFFFIFFPKRLRYGLLSEASATHNDAIMLFFHQFIKSSIVFLRRYVQYYMLLLLLLQQPTWLRGDAAVSRRDILVIVRKLWWEKYHKMENKCRSAKIKAYIQIKEYSEYYFRHCTFLFAIKSQLKRSSQHGPSDVIVISHDIL